MQEQKDHCKFSASLVNRARLCLSKKKKAHMWGCLAGGDVYIIYEPHDITFGAMKKPYQYRMTLHVSISFQRVCYTLVPFKIQFWSTQNVYFSLNGQNTSCLGTVYIRYISYMTLLLFLILFFFKQYSLCNPAILCLILPSTGITGMTMCPALRYIFL